MSVANEIARIKGATSQIRAKYVELGIAQSTDKIDDLATASEQIQNKGAVTATVAEGTTYTIPEGYHNGSGTVTGIAPGASGNVETWETPDMVDTTEEGFGSVYADAEQEGHEAWRAFDGKKDTYWAVITVGESGDTTSLVLSFDDPKNISGIRIVPPTGENAPNMPDGIGVTIALDEGGTSGFDLSDMTETNGVFERVAPSGDFLGEGVASITFECSPAEGQTEMGIAEIEIRTVESVTKYSLQAKVVNPTTRRQSITPDSGYYGLSSVTVNAVPESYKDVSVVSAGATDVLTGKVIVGPTGQIISGTMPNNGEMNRTIDGLTVTSVTIPAGYTDGGTIALDDSIEDALSEI